MAGTPPPPPFFFLCGLKPFLGVGTLVCCFSSGSFSCVLLCSRTREGAEVPCAVLNVRPHLGFRRWFCVGRPFLECCLSEGLRFVRVELLYLTESYSSIHLCLWASLGNKFVLFIGFGLQGLRSSFAGVGRGLLLEGGVRSYFFLAGEQGHACPPPRWHF